MMPLDPELLKDSSIKGMKKVYASSNSDSAKPPSFQIVVYAIQRILRPTFIYCQIPDILSLLVDIEMMRQRLVKIAQRLSRTRLDKKERVAVDTILQEDKDCRKTLRSIVNSLASLDIHTILRDAAMRNKTDRAPRVVDESIMLYFGKPFGEQPHPPQTLHEWACWYHFHENLTDEEAVDLCRTAEKITELTIDVAAYVQDRKTYAENIGMSEKEATFDACFPLTTDPNDLTELVDWYLESVEVMVNCLSD
ncbi:hypothetical protein BXZ70DRAFT_926087 [Cristinia sonorae]|uniref:Uncharacterized protein n=1 Tax=Cristinia sonorae TaxID=1940300 RepID=A0A8K0UUM4_9AGAR|nr:hypothetical protein BXZ70DRAFT_926087 [Cristinia sonorae]